jgi:dihydroflavonol-4-reductase
MLGNNLVRELLAQGWSVRALARSQDKARRVLGDRPEVRWVTGDLDDRAPWRSALQGVDVVFHTAAVFREYDGTDPGAWTALSRTNVEGTLGLATDAADAGVRRFVDTSTGGIVGGDVDDPAPPIASENLYFRSKLETLQRLQLLGVERGLEVISIHPGWMFGPYDAAPTAAGRLVTDFVAGRLPVCPAGGTTIADARDVARGMVAAASLGGQGRRWVLGGHYTELTALVRVLAEVSGARGPLLSLGDGTSLALARASELLGRWTGRAPLVTVMAMKTMQARHRLDSSRAVRDLGVTFRPLAETLRDTAAWLRKA